MQQQKSISLQDSIYTLLPVIVPLEGIFKILSRGTITVSKVQILSCNEILFFVTAYAKTHWRERNLINVINVKKLFHTLVHF